MSWLKREFSGRLPLLGWRQKEGLILLLAAHDRISDTGVDFALLEELEDAIIWDGLHTYQRPIDA